MVRSLRIEFPGGLYHVTSRGDRREVIYLSNADYHAVPTNGQSWRSDITSRICGGARSGDAAKRTG